jgi:hypothetical protein
LIFNEIKKRDPDLAALLTPQSIDFKNPKNPPPIKGGQVENKTEHFWQVRELADQGFRNSEIKQGGEDRKNVKGNTQVTHFLDITWALPLAPDPEFVKQTKSQREALTLTAAESLYHEFLHARILMESNPHWTSHALCYGDKAHSDFTTPAPIEARGSLHDCAMRLDQG